MLSAYALVGIVIASSAVCYAIAKHRRADTTYWCAMGALAGPLAIPFVLFSQPKE
jgi:hypothetical protein